MWAIARTTATDAVSILLGRDLAMVAGGATFYAALAVVPWLLLAVWGATVLSSAPFVESRLDDLRLLVPEAMGALPAWDALTAAAVGMGPWGALVALVPATFYGEGLRRAGLRLVPRPDRFTGWRARVAVLPLALAAPVLALGVLTVAPLLADLARAGGATGTLAQVVVAFHVTWIVLGVVLVWAFRVVAPGAPGAPATVVGAFTTSAVLSGFLQGFLLFLAIPVDVGIPFGGLGGVGAAVAIALWLFVLHVLLLTGWVATTALDRVLRDCSAPPHPAVPSAPPHPAVPSAPPHPAVPSAPPQPAVPPAPRPLETRSRGPEPTPAGCGR